MLQSKVLGSFTRSWTRRVDDHMQALVSITFITPPLATFVFYLAFTIFTMSEYWKSTPSYWCKFCSTFVKDTPIERKNHEASGKHQGSIQRSLRDLHKNKAQEERDKQRAKDEVARLNGLVSGKVVAGSPRVSGLTNITSYNKNAPGPGPTIDAAAQRRKHAMELAALGVELPPELKQEITGVGSWQTVSETVIQSAHPRSMAEILKEEQESKGEVLSRGVHKRKFEDEEGNTQPDVAPARKSKAWGSNLKSYPAAKAPQEDDTDLDSLLSGISQKKPKFEEKEEEESFAKIKVEENENAATLVMPPPSDNSLSKDVKMETSDPTVVFKKRKGKR
nr:uncharacterized protein c18h10.07 [Quercus suber]